MWAIWKLLVVLLLTLPPAAYVAGMVVGPPDLSYRNPEAPASPRSEPSRAHRPVTSGGPVAGTPQPTRESPTMLAGQAGHRQRVTPHHVDADRRASGSRAPRPRSDGVRLAVPGLRTPPAPQDPGPEFFQQAPPFPDLAPVIPDPTPQTPYDGTTPGTQGDLLETPTATEQDPGFDAPTPTPGFDAPAPAPGFDAPAPTAPAG